MIAVVPAQAANTRGMLSQYLIVTGTHRPISAVRSAFPISGGSQYLHHASTIDTAAAVSCLAASTRSSGVSEYAAGSNPGGRGIPPGKPGGRAVRAPEGAPGEGPGGAAEETSGAVGAGAFGSRGFLGFPFLAPLGRPPLFTGAAGARGGFFGRLWGFRGAPAMGSAVLSRSLPLPVDVLGSGVG